MLCPNDMNQTLEKYTRPNSILLNLSSYVYQIIVNYMALRIIKKNHPIVFSIFLIDVTSCVICLTFDNWLKVLITVFPNINKNAKDAKCVCAIWTQN